MKPAAKPKGRPAPAGHTTTEGKNMKPIERNIKELRTLLDDAERAYRHPASIASIMALIAGKAVETSFLAGNQRQQDEPQA